MVASPTTNPKRALKLRIDADVVGEQTAINRWPLFLAHSYPSLRSIEAIGLNEQFSGVNEQVWRLFFLDRPVGGTFRHISSMNCASARQRHR